jgi:hypothetical protein
MEGFLRKFRGNSLPNCIMLDAPDGLHHRLAHTFQLFNWISISMGYICLGQCCCWLYRRDVHLVYHRWLWLRLLNNHGSIRLESCSSTSASTSETSSCHSCDWSNHSSRWLRHICDCARLSHRCTSVELWRLVRHSANSELKWMGWLLR